MKNKERAIVDLVLYNKDDVIEGDTGWSIAFEYVKLLKNEFNNLIKGIMPIDLCKEAEEAYNAYLNEHGGINQDRLPLPKYFELPYEEREKLMVIVDHVITKFHKSIERDKDHEDAKHHDAKLKLALKPKSKLKSKSAR